MFKSLLTTALLFLTVITSVQAQSIDQTMSKVTFTIKNMKFRTVEGSFSNMTGTVETNNQGLQQIQACIPAFTVNTESKKRDKHLKNQDFFDVNNYPEICFQSSEINKQGNDYIAKGELTLHGVTKTIEIPLQVSNKQIMGNFTINRLDYKVGESTGTFMVGDQVNLTISCTLK